MKMSLFRGLFVILCIQCLPWFVSAKGKPNVLLLCIDDLRPELACFGQEYIHSPNIDRLAEGGRAFHRHYVQAPTCGASRYSLLTGCYGGASNGAIFARAKQLDSFPPSMPAWFRQNGYTTVSIGKVSHHPGGLGGPDWNDEGTLEMPNSWDRHMMPEGAWQHPRGAMHGLANGEIRVKAGEMDVFQSTEGDDSIYPDGLTTETALRQLEVLAKERKKPFFLAVGIIRPHLPFGAPAKYMEPYRDAFIPPIPHPWKPKGKTTWHGSGEFMKYNRWGRDPNKDDEFAREVRKHYAACVTYADALVGRILQKLRDVGEDENTIIVLWGDHGWHLGEHAIWGKHSLFEESLRSPLIIKHPGIPKPGEPTRSMCETVDIFPTLAELAGLPAPDFVNGVSLKPVLKDPAAAGHPAVSYGGKGRTIRTDRYRLIVHKGGDVELYDHKASVSETENRAKDDAEVVEELKKALEEKLQQKR